MIVRSELPGGDWKHLPSLTLERKRPFASKFYWAQLLYICVIFFFLNNNYNMLCYKCFNGISREIKFKNIWTNVNYCKCPQGL